MKKKFEFDNVFSLNVFDDIKGEIKVKYPDVKFFINKEKFYFIIECDDCQFDEYKHNILDSGEKVGYTKLLESIKKHLELL